MIEQSCLGKSRFLPFAALCCLLHLACGGPTVEADLVLLGGRIVTLDPDRPEVEALAVTGDRILAIGSREEIGGLAGRSTKILDLGDTLAVPGFIEGHGHFLGLAEARSSLDLGTMGSWDEVVDSVRRAASLARPDEVIAGRGWHQEKWFSIPSREVEGYPTHDDLSEVAPGNPVILTHASGHACLANARAMELAGVSASTPSPVGGTIVKDSAGLPTGVFLETAQNLLDSVRGGMAASQSREEVLRDFRNSVRLASSECLSKGVTSFHDAGASFETVDLYREMAAEGALDLRLYVMLQEPNERLRERIDSYRIVDAFGHRLTVRSIKRYIDGALGSRGAWLLEPYSDRPETLGLNTESVSALEEAAGIALEHGFQLSVHAIGDRANREILDLYERRYGQKAGTRDLRWRIEHAQHLDPSDIPRFRKLGVIAAMQGIHATSDGPWVIARLGEERAARGAYVWKQLLQSGAVVINGTDAPVEDVDPIKSFYASVSRTMKDGRRFFPEERMTREQALRSYTLSAAYAAFEENEKGSLTPGKLADIAVLSSDILTIPEDQILSARIIYTILGGKVAYEAKRGR